MLNTWKKSRGNKIINEDFSHIDFGYIPLNNIDFGDREHPSSFMGATLSDENYVSGHVGKILCSAISPDNKYILTGGEDHTAILWETDSGFVHAKIEMKSTVVFVSFSDDSRECFIGADGELPVVWDIEQAHFVFDFKELVENTLLFKKTLKSFVLGCRPKIIYSENKRYCTVTEERKFSLQYIDTDSVIVMDLHGRTYTEFYSDNDIGKVMSCSNNGKYILTRIIVRPETSEDRERNSYSEVWNIESGKMIFRSPTYVNIQNATFSPDNRYIYFDDVTSPNSNGTIEYGMLMIFDYLSGKEYAKPKHMTEHDFYTKADSLEFSSDGSLVLCGYSHGYDYSILSSDSWTSIAELGDLGKRNKLAVFSPDNQFCVVTVRQHNHSYDSCYVFDVASGSLLKGLSGHSNTITSLSFSSDSKMLVSTDSNGKVCLWNTTTWKEILSFGGSRRYVNSCTFLPKGELHELFDLGQNHQVIASVSSHSIELFDAETKRHSGIDPLSLACLQLYYSNYPITVTSFNFSSNGTILHIIAKPVNCDDEHQVCLISFDMKSLANTHIIEMDRNQPPYAFSYDHSILATYMSPNHLGEYLTLIDLSSNLFLYQSETEYYHDSPYHYDLASNSFLYQSETEYDHDFPYHFHQFCYAEFSSTNKFCFFDLWETHTIFRLAEKDFINLDVGFENSSGIILALFSPDEQFLLLNGYRDYWSGVAILFDVDGNKLHEFQAGNNVLLDSIGFSPDSKHCMVQSSKMVRIFDVRSGETVAEYKNNLWIILSIIKARMLTNDECEVYFSDGNVIKWNFITGKKRKVISKMKYKRICPTYSEDLRYGIDSLDDAVRLYDITTQTYVDLYNVDGVNVINCDFHDVHASEKMKAILFQNRADIEQPPENPF